MMIFIACLPMVTVDIGLDRGLGLNSSSAILFKFSYPFVSCTHAVPAMPMVNVCAVSAKMDGTLQIIESIWNELVSWN